MVEAGKQRKSDAVEDYMTDEGSLPKVRYHAGVSKQDTTNICCVIDSSRAYKS